MNSLVWSSPLTRPFASQTGSRVWPDSTTADMLLEMMESLNRDQGVTFLFSTHDPRVMARARRVIRLVDGRIESDKVRD